MTWNPPPTRGPPAHPTPPTPVVILAPDQGLDDNLAVVGLLERVLAARPARVVFAGGDLREALRRAVRGLLADGAASVTVLALDPELAALAGPALDGLAAQLLPPLHLRPAGQARPPPAQAGCRARRRAAAAPSSVAT